MLPVHHVYPRFHGRRAATERCAGTPAPRVSADWFVSARRRVGGDRRRGPERARFALALLGLGVGACGPLADADAAGQALRFEGSVATLEMLGEEVLAAMVRADTAALRRVRLTEQEHNEVVWPELPASAPELGFPVDYAWTNIQNRNVRALSRTLPLYRDRDVRSLGVECRGGTEVFATFVVLTDCWVVLTPIGSDERFEAQIFKDVLVRGGGHKIFRYYDEGPRPRGGAPDG